MTFRKRIRKLIKEEIEGLSSKNRNEIIFFIEGIEGYQYMVTKNDLFKVLANKNGRPPKIFNPNEAVEINPSNWDRYIFVLKDGVSPNTPEGREGGPYSDTHPMAYDFKVTDDPIII